jgi:SRSO17 transposase
MQEIAMKKKPKRQFRRLRRPPASGRKPTMPLTTQEMDIIRSDLTAYHRRFHSVFQRREQRDWSLFYLCGQLSELERKTVEAMVLALIGPDSNAVRAGQQFIGQGEWDAQKLILQHQQQVARSLGDPAGIVIVDGSGIVKQGQDSAGVGHQYCGSVGKVANCQNGVFVAYLSPWGFTLVDVRLYLQEEWFDDDHRDRWKKCGIPNEITFRTEAQLAQDMLLGLIERDVLPFRWVVFDEHFGENTVLLDTIETQNKWYFAEVPCTTRVWLRRPQVEPPGRGPLGRPRTRPRLAANAAPSREVRAVAATLPASAWHRRTIKEGSKGPLVAEFAFLRVVAARDQLPGPRVWLVVRRSLGPQPEFKYFLSNAPADCAQSDLVHLSGTRWPVETSLEEGKGEVGLDQYETRTWRGWYHHMAQSFIALHFLVLIQLKFKKTAGTDHRTGPRIGRPSSSGGHQIAPRRSRHCGLSATSQSRGLSFPSKTNAGAPSQGVETQKRQSLVVMRSLVVI